jgi:hypothetical protein
MKSIVACLVVVGGILSATAASSQSTPAAAADVYHVHFGKAAPGQAAAVGASLMAPDKSSPMPEHVLVLRHQEGDDWDYVVIQRRFRPNSKQDGVVHAIVGRAACRCLCAQVVQELWRAEGA